MDIYKPHQQQCFNWIASLSGLAPKSTILPLPRHLLTILEPASLPCRSQWFTSSSSHFCFPNASLIRSVPLHLYSYWLVHCVSPGLLQWRPNFSLYLRSPPPNPFLQNSLNDPYKMQVWFCRCYTHIPFTASWHFFRKKCQNCEQKPRSFHMA